PLPGGDRPRAPSALGAAPAARAFHAAPRRWVLDPASGPAAVPRASGGAARRRRPSSAGRAGRRPGGAGGRGAAARAPHLLLVVAGGERRLVPARAGLRDPVGGGVAAGRRLLRGLLGSAGRHSGQAAAGPPRDRRGRPEPHRPRASRPSLPWLPALRGQPGDRVPHDRGRGGGTPRPRRAHAGSAEGDGEGVSVEPLGVEPTSPV